MGIYSYCIILCIPFETKFTQHPSNHAICVSVYTLKCSLKNSKTSWYIYSIDLTCATMECYYRSGRLEEAYRLVENLSQLHQYFIILAALWQKNISSLRTNRKTANILSLEYFERYFQTIPKVPIQDLARVSMHNYSFFSAAVCLWNDLYLRRMQMHRFYNLVYS